MAYSSLHNHTYYSIQDGLASPKEYMDRAVDLGLNALAITEHGNLYSAPYIHKLKKDYPSLKVLYGVEAYECFDHNEKDKDNKYFHLIVLAKNETGRKAINKLITQSEFYGKYYKPRVDLNMMKPYANDIIVTSACMAGKLHREKDFEKCIGYVEEYKSIFPHFFLEMQSHTDNDQIAYNKKILEISIKTNTPFIITTDSHSATKEQVEFQTIFVQIAQDADTTNEGYTDCYMQSEEEIYDIMIPQIGRKNVEIGLNNTNLIADLCDDVDMPFQDPKLPPFPIPDGYTERTYIEKLLQSGWKNRKFDSMTEEERAIRKERLDYELDVIDKMGFIGYFLIVWDFMEWGRKNGVLFGDGGRGSGAGSLVCYLLGLTGIDPVRYGLIFERFLNPERVGMPDLDIDLSPREKVIEYLQQKYGLMSVCQISNFSYETPNVAIKDVVRILDKDPKRFNKFGKKIGTKKAFEISKLFDSDKWEDCIAVNGNSIKKYSDEIYKDVFRIAKELSGRVRHVSIHAGGVGIVGTEIDDYMPMRVTDKGEHVIQVDKKIVEEIGIVKIDLLGLNTLSIIQKTIEIAGIDHWEIDPNNDKFITDKKMYETIGNGDTGNIFQLESKGMRDLCRQIKPKCLEEISDILALYRPDVLQTGMLDDYINRKINGEKINYIHPDMEKILGKTFGVQVYQEQSMEITKVFGGRSYGGADTLRKIISKKLLEKIKPEITKLRKEIIDNGYSKEVSDYICDIMEGFGSYSFNKSHSMGYSVITLQTAYLKSHYTVAFYCAVLNCCNGDNSKINKYINEAQAHDVEILPPHINNSQKDFSVVNEKIMFGIGAINTLGEVLVEKLIREKETNGLFRGIVQVRNRVPELSTAQMVYLIKAGAFGLDHKPDMLSKFLKHTVSEKFKSEYKEYNPVKSLPSLLVLKTEYGIDTDLIKDKEERLRLYNKKRKELHETVLRLEWIENQKQKKRDEYQKLWEKYSDQPEYWEFEALSIFLTNNPFEKIYDYISRPFSVVEDGQEFFDIGIISKIQKKKDRNKRTMCFFNLYSYNGIIEGTCFSSTYEKFTNLISKGNKVAVFGERSTEDTFLVRNIETIDDWLKRCNIRPK